jgi:hypothetical protein
MQKFREDDASEAERSLVNNRILGIQKGFLQQREMKLNLMKRLVADKES